SEILREQVVWTLVSRLSKRVTPSGSRRRIRSNEPRMHRKRLMMDRTARESDVRNRKSDVKKVAEELLSRLTRDLAGRLRALSSALPLRPRFHAADLPSLSFGVLACCEANIW